MKRFCIPLFFVILMTFSLDGSAQRSGGATPIHNAGARLLENDSFALYEYRRYDGMFCDNRWGVQISLVLKVGPDYPVTDDAAYRQRFEKEILPVIKRRCDSVTRVIMFNFIKGVILDRNSKEHGYDDQPGYERPLSIIKVNINQQGEILYETSGGPVSLAGIRQGHERRERAETKAREEVAAAQQAALKIADADYSSDGKLKVTDVNKDHKKLFFQIYDEEFIELSRTDKAQDDYLPYAMYSGVIQGYSDLCRSSLSPSAVPVEIYSERYLGTEYSLFRKTEYYERYLAKTVYMEPKYEAAYRSSVLTTLKKMNEFWIRERRDASILQYYFYKSPEFIQLAMDSRRLISNNGCKNPSTLKFIENLHNFVTGNWDTKTRDGYKYAETNEIDAIKRFYAKVPPAFTPEFPRPATTKEMQIFLNQGDQSMGLKWIVMRPFSLYPLARTSGIDSHTPEEVVEAINSKKYFVAECAYYLSGNRGGQLYYWNANGPLPPPSVQAYVKSVIKEPRKFCPATFTGR